MDQAGFTTSYTCIVHTKKKKKKKPSWANLSQVEPWQNKNETFKKLLGANGKEKGKISKKKGKL